MLSEKPWKLDLLARLLAGVVICVFAAPVLLVAADFPSLHAKVSALKFYALAGASLAFGGAALALTLRPWPADWPARRLALLGLCFFASLNLSAWIQHIGGADLAEQPSVGQVVISTLAFQGTALLLVHWFVRQHQTGWREAFGLRWRGLGRAVLLGALLALVAVPLGWLLQAGCAKLLTLLHYEAREQRMVEILRLTESWPGRLYMGFAAIVLAPVAEETLFRGILYPAIKHLGFPRAALWGSSILFAAVHANLPSFLPLVLLAAALALLYEKTGNLLAPMTAHACFNAANALMLFLTQMVMHSG